MIVLDCSAALAMVRNTSDGNALRMLLRDDEEVIAPRFLAIETADTIAKYVCSNLIEDAEARNVFSCVMGLVDVLCDDENLIEEAIAEAIRFKSSVYDLLYFVLARRHMATLFTLDKKLRELCLSNGVNCAFPDIEL